MPSSDDARVAVRALGAFLTAAEASAVAARLYIGESFTSASAAIESSRRPEVAELIRTAGLRQSPDVLAAVLLSIAGARGAVTGVNALWTMPGFVAQSGPLTTSVTQLVADARSSVVCSTFNFQETSGLWIALRDAASRPEIGLRVYVDAHASNGASGPDASTIAANLNPGVVLRTRPFQGRLVRNHAKFLCVDHRFLVVTSANFSWSAENANVELGVLLDNPSLAESVEREMRVAENSIYEAVAA